MQILMKVAASDDASPKLKKLIDKHTTGHKKRFNRALGRVTLGAKPALVKKTGAGYGHRGKGGLRRSKKA